MRKRLHELIQHLKDEHSSPEELGRAVAVGLFIGTLPFYGIHLAICIAISWVFGLNKATVYLAANISNPLFAPVLVGGGLMIGELLRFGTLKPVDWSAAHSFLDTIYMIGGDLPDRFLSVLLGDAILGLGFAAIGGPMAVRAARRWKEAKEADSASS